MFSRLFPLLALAPVLTSAYFIPETWVGLGALIMYLAVTGLAMGNRLAPSLPRLAQVGLGIMACLASLSVLGSLVYYSSAVTTESLLAVLILVSVLTCLSKPSTPSHTPSSPDNPANTVDYLLFSLGSTAVLGWWIAIVHTDITTPVRSLWLVLEPVTLVALGLAASCFAALCLRQRAHTLTFILLAALLVSATAVAANIYSLGYGFDPFLHRATVAHIAEHGTISPKPLYYIGQYALELIALKLFALPLFPVDTYLAPLLAGLGITTALASRRITTQSPSFVLASLLLLPLAAFVQTTPQALAFVFTAWCLFAPTRPRALGAIFALAAVITHPLAGIGALIYILLLSLDDLPESAAKLRRGAILLVTSCAAVAIPLAFSLQAQLANLPLRFIPSQLFQLQNLPLTTFFGTNFNAWGDLAYAFISNSFMIIVVLAMAGIWLTPKTQRGWYIPALVAGAMFVNFVIVSLAFDFSFLITYERLDFALRLLTLTTLFLLPYVAVLFGHAAKKLAASPVSLRLGVVTLLALVFMGNVYGAYPRHDNYARSAGFNLGPADLEAVRAIDAHAEGEHYIVLSDQALAAAAVQAYGFKTYYHDTIFFYPIPTGGPLYQHFLRMVEDTPSPETVTAAMDLAGVDLAYFAVHDYWWRAPQIIENTKNLSPDWFAVGQGAVTVFVFHR
jgi:hypothetical protein